MPCSTNFKEKLDAGFNNGTRNKIKIDKQQRDIKEVFLEFREIFWDKYNPKYLQKR